MLVSDLVSLFNDLLSQQGRLRKGGSQLLYHCPFCSDKNLITQKLEIAVSGANIGKYHCWRCNTKGKTFGSLLKKLKASPSYRERLFKLTGDIKLSRSYNKKEGSSVISLPEEFIPFSQPRNTPEYRNALIYLKRRGVTPADIFRYNIGYCAEGDYRFNVIIPSYDQDGKLNFFIGRRYYNVENTIPYKKPEFPMNAIIGFENFVNYNEPIILVESVFNAITIRRNAIPLFGKFPSNRLYEKMIINKVKKVYVCLDSDAKKDAVSICKRLLRLGITPFLVDIVGGKDPNEIGFEKSWECIKQAKEIGFEELLDYELGL